MGTGLELDVITAVVLGGTSIFGGRGTIIGTLLGLILMQALKNGLALAGVKGDGTIVVIGTRADRDDPHQQSGSTGRRRLSTRADPGCGRRPMRIRVNGWRRRMIRTRHCLRPWRSRP